MLASNACTKAADDDSYFKAECGATGGLVVYSGCSDAACGECESTVEFGADAREACGTVTMPDGSVLPGLFTCPADGSFLCDPERPDSTCTAATSTSAAGSVRASVTWSKYGEPCA